MLARGTYYNPRRRLPHIPSESEWIARKKGNEGSCTATQIVDRYDKANEYRIRVMDHIEEILVANDSRENALIVACSRVPS